MGEERYPDERRILRIFLGELQPVAECALGCDCLLVHAIRRALASNGLDEMRRARRHFNNLPRSAKRRISEGIVARSVGSGSSSAAAQRPGAQATSAFELSEPGVRIEFIRRNPDRGRPA
jgi:hypothetical protein